MGQVVIEEPPDHLRARRLSDRDVIRGSSAPHTPDDYLPGHLQALDNLGRSARRGVGVVPIEEWHHNGSCFTERAMEMQSPTDDDVFGNFTWCAPTGYWSMLQLFRSERRHCTLESLLILEPAVENALLCECCPDH